MPIFDTLRSVLRFRRIELDANKRRLARAANVDDLRVIAQRRLPHGVFDYIDGGAEDERTMRANRDAFASVTFRPRILREVGTVDVGTTLLGHPLAYPLVLAPTGFTRIADPQGSRIRLLCAGQNPEQRRFAGAVRPDHADDAARR